MLTRQYTALHIAVIVGVMVFGVIALRAYWPNPADNIAITQCT